MPEKKFGSVEMASAYDELSDPQFTHGKVLIALLGIGPGDRVTEHYHPYSEEFIFVAEGELEIDLDGEAVKVPAQHAILVPRTVRHRLRNEGGVPALAVFQLCPRAPEPRLGHVDTEPGPGDPGPGDPGPAVDGVLQAAAP